MCIRDSYNILLKDDKSYPWIAVTAEEFPRVLSTRQIVRDGSQYYGPYGSISAQRAVLDFIREERTFGSAEELKAQIAYDTERVRKESGDLSWQHLGLK